jgi:hypothetical protein
MSEMVERGAQAIVNAGYNPYTAAAIARVVIEAMREPTEEMFCEGIRQFGNGLDDRDAKDVWMAMIDEALK